MTTKKRRTAIVETTDCVACGCCVKVCPMRAIHIDHGIAAQVDRKKCVGCGKCVEACPFGVMVKAEDSPVSSKCIACGICAKACPADVLEVVES